MTQPNELQTSDPLAPVDLNTQFPVNFRDIEGFIETVEAQPTYIPRKLSDSLKIFNGILNFWDKKNSLWKQAGGQSLNVAIGDGTSPATAQTTTITCGFRPKLIRIKAFLDSPTAHAFCICEATTTSNGRGIKVYRPNSTNTYMSTYSVSGIVDLIDQTTGSSVVYAVISNISDTGFTIDWQNTTLQCVYQWETLS
jgi:hypothetical protein